MNEFRARLMFEVGTLDESELGARSGGFGSDDFNTELGVDELLAIQNTMFEARTVCKACVTTWVIHWLIPAVNFSGSYRTSTYG